MGLVVPRGRKETSKLVLLGVGRAGWPALGSEGSHGVASSHAAYKASNVALGGCFYGRAKRNYEPRAAMAGLYVEDRGRTADESSSGSVGKSARLTAHLFRRAPRPHHLRALQRCRPAHRRELPPVLHRRVQGEWQGAGLQGVQVPPHRMLDLCPVLRSKGFPLHVDYWNIRIKY